MKAYTKPELQIIDVTTASLLMGSINTSSYNEDSFNVGIKNGGGSSTPSQMTREQSGAGGGLWSDMK